MRISVRRYSAVELLILLGLLTVVLAVPAQAQVRRSEAIAIAETYLRFKWKPTAANAFHGLDQRGLRVDTPDIGFTRPGIRPGWWKAGEINQGMPYKWGGFNTPAEFTHGLGAGRYAGDVYTAEKRRLGDRAVSEETIGIDCSGLISRCWKLPRPYSTQELPGLCDPLPSFDALKPGDILNAPNQHVLMFKGFADAERTAIYEYEAGSPPTWKVLLNRISIARLQREGYQPLRYRQMRDR